jgi:hypothetical protein
MHELINRLTFSLFRKNSLEECSAEEIADLAKQYPYFSSAQLLLSAKQKQINHQDFEKQLLATSLYVNNPLWLNHLLNSRPTNTEKMAGEEKIPVAEVNEEPFNDELVLANPRHGSAPAATGDEKINVTPLPSIIKKVEDKEQSLVFEPYYTVDYFASQGIKNIIEEKPKDRFSQQLKSFTEWLKTIRQMPPHQIATMTDGGSEEKVVQLATNSLEEKEVDTEAMAEVWIKQGHPEKAAEIYQKLSLLNPSKSSYFAVLIEKLKKN